MEALNFTMLKRGGGGTLVHGARSLMHKRFIHACLHKSLLRTQERLACIRCKHEAVDNSD